MKILSSTELLKNCISSCRSCNSFIYNIKFSTDRQFLFQFQFDLLLLICSATLILGLGKACYHGI